jgi:hypothetical protein
MANLRFKRFYVFFLSLAILGVERAAAFSKVSLDGFVDTYYAMDFNQPPAGDRPYTILPTRQNEFAVNLATLGMSVARDRARARLALHTGTSVFANYSNEVREESGAGPYLADLIQHIQEAYAGYQIAENLWVDAGIYFSHIGTESFISKSNWTYTRSLVADFSPYYQSGVRFSWKASPSLSVQFHVMNGWQNILETNRDKALGTQIIYQSDPKWSLTWNTFVGKETELRIFQDWGLKVDVSPSWEVLVTFDYGMQKGGGQGYLSWHGESLVNRFAFSETTHLAVRAERYFDPNKIIAKTSSPNGLQAWGASTNLDIQLTPELLWRNEVKWLTSKDAIYPSDTGNRNNVFLAVTSLGVTL